MQNRRVRQRDQGNDPVMHLMLTLAAWLVLGATDPAAGQDTTASAGSVPAAAAATVTVGDARESLAETRAAIRQSYNARRRPSRSSPPRDRCEPAAPGVESVAGSETGAGGGSRAGSAAAGVGADAEQSVEHCFGGDHECGFINACAWLDGRAAMLALAHRFDSTAAVVRAAGADALDPEQRRWLEGQRTGAWTRLGDFQRARDALGDCASYDWWCDALRGYVDHRQGRFTDAERRFHQALSTMPPGRACYWTDTSLLADSTALSLRHGGSPRCRDAAELDTFWTLADPLFSMPGNDRMTEHYARHVELAIHEDFLELYEGGHTPSHHSSIMRLGWPNGFRVLPRLQDAALHTELTWSGGIGLVAGDAAAEDAAAEDAAAGGTVAGDPRPELTMSQDAFVPRPDDRREQYRPDWGTLHGIPVQYGFVRRNGEPGILVRSTAPALADVPRSGHDREDGLPAPLRDSPGTWHIRSWDGATWRDGITWQDEVATSSESTVTGWIPSPWTAQVFSLESIAGARALRGRSGTRPPTSSGTASVSSVLLLDGGAPTDPDPAAAMLASLTVQAGTDIAAWWEVYDAAGRHAAIQLTTLRVDRPGLLARLLRQDTAPVRTVRWQEQLDPSVQSAPRRVTLDVTDLPAGEYELRLDITLDDGTRLNADTRFRVVQ